MSKQHFVKPFDYGIIVLGAGACLSSALALQPARLDLQFLIIALAAICFGSRIGVRIPRVGGEITVSDTFVFAVLLLYGGEPAVLLATVETLCSALRFSRKPRVVLSNAMMIACSTFVTVCLLRLCFGSAADFARDGSPGTYLGALCLIALAQYACNSGLVALRVAWKTERSVWETWKQHYLWTSITYFAGASAAGIVVKFVGVFGFYSVLAATPVVAIIYFTYRVYLKNVEVSEWQAAQAETHARELEDKADALQESEERFRSAFDHAPIGMALVAPAGRFLQVNRSLCAIVGYDESELLDLDIRSVSHPHDFAASSAETDRLLAGELPSYQIEQRFMHKEGREVWVSLSASLAGNAESKSPRLIFQIKDVTDRKRAEERLQYEASHDSLTGLPNRARFMELLQTHVDRAARLAGAPLFAVLFLDLDRFKIINDSLGHHVGDLLLEDTARRLKACVRPGDTVARLGGDEFTILLGELDGADDAVSIAERINRELALPFDLDGNEVSTSASIGIALSSAGYERADDLLRDADAAMYRAKAQGKSQHAVFDETMHEHATKLLHIENDLRRAIERKEFVLHYQPITCLRTGEIRGFEALLRWRHPERGMIPPGDFIPVAEDTGLIEPLGEWALTEACRQMRVWHEMFGDPSLTISVNMSAKQFARQNSVAKVKGVLHATRLDPRSLNLEITESVVMRHSESATDTLSRLRALGVSLSLDDFGTGYSSLSYLHRFPLSTLKIDRSFVSLITEKDENVEIVRTIIMLARNLQMRVVAEGVETIVQLKRLRELGCDQGQGFLFSRPVDAEAATSLLLRARLFTVHAPRPEEHGATDAETALVPASRHAFDCDVDWSQMDTVS